MTLRFADSVNALDALIRRAAPGDTIELERFAFGQWSIALTSGGWLLTNGHQAVSLGGPAGARLRIVLNGCARLLVGDTGYATIQSAIDAAQAGDTILVAPGTYHESRILDDAEPDAAGGTHRGCGLLIDKSLTLQGVLDDGSPVRDRDDVSATAIATMQSPNGASFIVLADDVVVQGLGFVPGGRGEVVALAHAKCFEILGERFSLVACVVERNAPARSASAVHFNRRGCRDPGGSAVVSGNSLHGSITIEPVTPRTPACVAIVDNDVFGDLLPPVRVTCDLQVLTASQPESMLPVVADNTLRAHGRSLFSFFLECREAASADALAGHSLDAYLRQALDAHAGGGALLVDAAGHVKVWMAPDASRSRKTAQGLGMYASAQSALDAATDGDTLYVGPGARNRMAADVPTRELSNAEVLSMLDRTSDLAAPVRLLDAMGLLKQVHTTIQAAIDCAVPGDRIVVAPSYHVGDLCFRKPVTLSGANAGLPGSSARRGLETHLSGRVLIGSDAGEVVIDGFTIIGSVSTEPCAITPQRLALRNCVIDGSGERAAVSVLGGSGVTIIDNRIIGGADEAIYVPYGFDNLAIVGNTIQIAEGAAGIALNGGAGVDNACMLGNILLGGDYGVLIEVDEGLEQAGDAITVTGNQFGELEDGASRNGMVIAAIHANRPVPFGLEQSLGACLDLNTYHLSGAAVASDVTFVSCAPAYGSLVARSVGGARR